LFDPNWCPDRSTRTLHSWDPNSILFRNSVPNLNLEWSFQNTNTQACTRNPDGTITCVSDHPNALNGA